MILFISACGDDQTEQNETGKVEKLTNEEIEELEKVNKETCETLEEQGKSDVLEMCRKLKEKEEKTGRESEADSEHEQDDDENIEDLSVEETTDVEVQEFTIEEQQEMTQLFYDWAVERAEIGGMAVTKIYFSHGAGGSGDWYANTPDGEVQAQNLNNPGFEHFDIHAIGGVAFYHPISGDYGIDEYAHVPGVGEGYSRLAKSDTNIHKYMLADNGVVYELIAKRENTALSSGFGEYADDGTRGDFTPNAEFEISQDQDAQQKWQRILGMYER